MVFGYLVKQRQPGTCDAYGEIEIVGRTRNAVRTNRNTLDLRGKRADEALEEAEYFLDRMLQHGEPVGWILHGHGTGALKQAVRRWLPRQKVASSWRPANADEGGDAYTRVEIR